MMKKTILSFIPVICMLALIIFSCVSRDTKNPGTSQDQFPKILDTSSESKEPLPDTANAPQSESDKPVSPGMTPKSKVPGTDQRKTQANPPDSNPDKTGSDSIKGFGCSSKGQHTKTKVKSK